MPKHDERPLATTKMRTSRNYSLVYLVHATLSVMRSSFDHILVAKSLAFCWRANEAVGEFLRRPRIDQLQPHLLVLQWLSGTRLLAE